MLEKCRNKRVLIILISVFLAGALIGGPALAQLGGILKGAAVAILVDKFSDQLNDLINKATGGNKLGPKEATKVVPILSLGQGSFVGGAQVLGPKDKVETVKAVGQVETKLGGQFRIKALFPMTTRSTSTSAKNIQKVEGVGVSAVIDVRL